MQGECWIFRGKPRKDGYTKVRIKNHSFYAHRVSYHLFNGGIEHDQVIDHICRNRACINPKHLRVISNKENILCGESATAKNARKTHCIKGHLFGGTNLKIKSSGRGRYCYECHKQYNYKMYWKGKRNE